MYPKSVQFKQRVVPQKQLSQADFDVLEYRLECLRGRVRWQRNVICFLCVVLAMCLVFK